MNRYKPGKAVARGLSLAALSSFILILETLAASVLPPLNISSSNGNPVISFPIAAFHAQLEASTDATPGAVWGSSTVPLRQSGDGANIQGALNPTNNQEFCRLRAQASIPVFQFAIFYYGLLEFSTSSAGTYARVHANGDIYTGSAAPVAFSDVVSMAGTISSPPNNGQTNWTYTGTFSGNPPTITNVPPLLLAIGTNDARVLIDVPPSGESPSSTLGQNRLYNLAHVMLTITNGSTTHFLVTATVRSSVDSQVPGADPAPLALTNLTGPGGIYPSLPFFTMTSFVDQRENETVLCAQIDVAQYGRWIQTNVMVLAKFPPGSGRFPAILYVFNSVTNTPAQMACVRLVNGQTVPTNGGLGFTVATSKPLYVEGHYNCPNPAYLGTTNTTACTPCALMGDALTILSPTWMDSDSGSSFTVRNATFTTINAAILVGNVPSTGYRSTQFSGGVLNLPRLLENWSGRTLTLNTSLVCLFPSTTATHPFINPGTYYYPPTRQFAFDQNYLHPSKLPPGTPVVWPTQ